MKSSRRLDDAAVTRLERLAAETRAAVGGVSPVRDGWPAGAKTLRQELLNAVERVAGAHVADLTVTDWMITDHPIADLILFYRRAPGVRVQRLDGGPVGTIQAPRGQVEEMAQAVDALFRAVYVVWDGGEGRELVRAASLKIVKDKP